MTESNDRNNKRDNHRIIRKTKVNSPTKKIVLRQIQSSSSVLVLPLKDHLRRKLITRAIKRRAYRRLKSVVPSLSSRVSSSASQKSINSLSECQSPTDSQSRSSVPPVIIVQEACKYIDLLHQSLLEKFRKMSRTSGEEGGRHEMFSPKLRQLIGDGPVPTSIMDIKRLVHRQMSQNMISNDGQHEMMDKKQR